MASFKDILKGAGKGALEGLSNHLTSPLMGGPAGGAVGGLIQGLMGKFGKDEEEDQPETMVSRPFKSTLVKNSNPRSPYKMEY